MLTRRENLLIRPWQQRRFQSHRRKVLTAMPAIDAAAPACRGHVTIKLKKAQREEERADRIESDNVRLLQRMAVIMRTSRLDNRWLQQPPGGFLGRIGVYVPLQPDFLPLRGPRTVSPEAEVTKTSPREGGRRATCRACAAKRSELSQQPIRQVISQSSKLPSVRSQSAPAAASTRNPPPRITPSKRKTPAPSSGTPAGPRGSWESQAAPSRGTRVAPAGRRGSWLQAASSRVVLTRGQLRVSVAFPPHTGLTLERAGDKPRVLDTEMCACAAGSRH